MLQSGAAAIALVGGASAAGAQSKTVEGFAPPVTSTDSRGVDLVSGRAVIHIPAASFGNGATALSASFDISLPGSGPIPSTDFVRTVGRMLGASLSPKAETGGGYVDELGTFTPVIFPGESGYYLAHSMHYYTNPDGTQYSKSIGPTHMMQLVSTDPDRAGTYNSAGDRGIYDPNQATFARIVKANGEEWKFVREWVTVSTGQPGTTYQLPRLKFLVSSRGYAIQFLYMTDVAPTTDLLAGTWMAPRKITAYNKAFVYCNEALLQECSAVSALPSTEIVYNGTAGTVLITPPGSSEGVEFTYAKSGSNWYGDAVSRRHTAIPGSTVSYQYALSNAGSSYLQRLTDSDGQWNYMHEVYIDDSGYVPEMHATATNPAGGVIEVVGHSLFGQMEILTDEVPSTHWMHVSTRDANYRVYGFTNPQQDRIDLDRDTRNNVIWASRVPIAGSGQPAVTVYQATYPADCMNPRTCNRPITETDANGNVTEYTYAPEHGGVLTETGPSVPTRQTNGTMANVRPQKRYEYAQRYAWISNGSGGYQQAATPIWLLVRERFCRTTAASGSSCAGGAADEVVTDFDYGPNSGPNTLLLRGVSVTADGRTIRTCYSYDSSGNRISETQPNAGLGSCS